VKFHFASLLLICSVFRLHIPPLTHNTSFHFCQACVKPEIIERQGGAKRAKIEMKPDGTYLEISSEGKQEVLESAKITLNDCLACR
jgi:hypothetical protein